MVWVNTRKMRVYSSERQQLSRRTTPAARIVGRRTSDRSPEYTRIFLFLRKPKGCLFWYATNQSASHSRCADRGPTDVRPLSGIHLHFPVLAKTKGLPVLVRGNFRRQTTPAARIVGRQMSDRSPEYTRIFLFL